MRFIVRPGTDPVATADATLLKTLGLPYGGVVAVGKTHVLVKAGTVPEPTALLLGPRAQRNAGVSAGTSVDVTRAVLAPAAIVVLDQEETPDDPGRLVAAWQGRPVSSGDHIDLPDEGEARIAEVVPNGAAMVGPATRIVGLADRVSVATPTKTAAPDPSPVQSQTTERKERVTSDAALLAGLETQRDLLAGWLTLLTSPQDLPATWGLPRVAGVWVEGPPGCGRPELVRAAAGDVAVPLHDVALDRVFKPERLLEVLQGALAKAGDRGVIFVDRVELLTGDDALSNYRTQFGAVFRWFLDSAAERRGLAVVLGASSLGTVDPGLASNPLLPRSLSIPPPDIERRKLLFQAALSDVPVSDIDYATLAARSAGFSGTDIVGAVLHASAGLARRGGMLTTAEILDAIRDTTPSLGSTSIGEIPSHGFDQVADLVEVKQRLTEAVIWPISQPERFKALGIDPPRGILLHGPPGTGKTFVVRAVAHEAGAAFFPIKGAELLDKYVGESERGVRDVFARARTAAPSIIFFDELDALAPVRGRSTTSVTDSVVAALLTELDGVTERGDVAVIGATNRPDLIDPALLRSGRFETHIELGLPDVTARRAMLDITDVPFADDVDLDELAQMTEGLSFADLEGMLREAALTALRRDTSAREVTLADLMAARERFL
ncbi:MAG TPA: AAA family ATPase [Acidimicrobiia bacterium]|jgi:transitional endoplasmic reticulum ATPase